MSDWHVTAERRYVVVPRGGGLAPLVIQCVISLNADAKDRSAPVGSWWWWVDSVETQDDGDDTSCGDVPTAADARAACDARLASRWGYVTK